METQEFAAVSYKVGDQSGVLRQFFVKQHIGNNDVKPSDRTLLVMNVPPYMNDECFKLWYGQCGAIENVFFHKKPKSGIDEIDENSGLFLKSETSVSYKCAYIIFKTPTGLAKALECTELDVVPLEIVDTLGIDKYIEDYKSKFIDVNDVKKEVEEYMKYYDQNFEEEKQQSKAIIVDADGFIKVTKHSKKPKIPRKVGVSEKIMEKQKKALEKQTLLSFYRCQLRQQKEDKLIELQKKFEKDKKRIAIMKENRKFRPY